MWFFSVEAWSLFFRVGYLAFVILCTIAGGVFMVYLINEAWRFTRHAMRPHRWSQQQIEHLVTLIQSDHRWLAHNLVADALTERYLNALAPDWRQRCHLDASYFRDHIGLTPHKAASPEASVPTRRMSAKPESQQ